MSATGFASRQIALVSAPAAVGSALLTILVGSGEMKSAIDNHAAEYTYRWRI